ncbi:enoyl-CoA hydratase/isomerase family protein [Amphritea japonica]|uniref:3-hydroxyisobutyryl-CoA hydrolase n=1 Tax=Amphritea japonica ATCC BAA-1530 TaxID=1278309 RepID=A0A7R6P3M4_9GAMM|nr:enoyl-CoA hydratase/isomerase family protein [Amphritea japonica]BBB26598.1 enoyl-CoA hydratase [Amphritea japonica ATCC BAA-1530]
MSCVLFNEYPTQDGKKVVEICLNAEPSLNALTLEMVDLIQPKMDAWKRDDSVVAVLLNSSGQKAFCVGGDVVNLYKAMTGEMYEDFPLDFFTREYTLDYTIHTYPKPIICWGSGFVMGGGMGLINGCSHRIVTETTHMAMPEVTIGLYPDVGGSWFLNHMPGRTGLFMGLTGHRMNAADALYLGLADRFVGAKKLSEMIERLQGESWQGDAYASVNRVLRVMEAESEDQMVRHSPVQSHFELIQKVTDHDTLKDIITAILTQESDDRWFKGAQKTLAHGSPMALYMIHQQWLRSRHLSLREVFQHELVLSVRACQEREFPEGVRALLVDKDNCPAWTFPSLGEVDTKYVDSLFTSPWDKNPLAHL